VIKKRIVYDVAVEISYGKIFSDLGLAAADKLGIERCSFD
jgi:hypothetical protein